MKSVYKSALGMLMKAMVLKALTRLAKNRDPLELAEIPVKLDYAVHLWQEKQIKSVANVTRRDVREFLALAAEIPIRPEIQEYPLEDANRVLVELKERQIRGVKVLRIA